MSVEQRHRQIVAVVLATDPTLSAPQVEAAIAAVAGHPAALRSLAAALTTDPAALMIAAPPVVGRLVEALRAQGATSLPEPSRPALPRCMTAGAAHCEGSAAGRGP